MSNPQSFFTTKTPSGSTFLPQASEIIPRLYISDLHTAENPATLDALGITHVLSVMCGPVDLPPSVPLRRRCHKQILLEDNPFAELAAYLPASTAFLREALRDPSARVLVHCVKGVSRSASVVSAFLVSKYEWTPAEAVAFVKSKRAVAEPNFGFAVQLQEYADTLQLSRVD